MEQARETASKEVEDRLHRFDRLKEFYKFLPDRGLAVDDILREATNYRTMSDILFERGHLCGSVYSGEDEDTERKQKMVRSVSWNGIYWGKRNHKHTNTAKILSHISSIRTVASQTSSRVQ